ncbi:MAG: GNAT family N-acetyltransferase [Clostridia bacterium]|nr:GNAT family N-acetyltransferase [Clostridia bacterium]
MKIGLRKWQLFDAKQLATALSNKNVLDHLRDGLPYPYTEKDAEEYIAAMLSADKNDTFAFAIVCDGNVVGSIGAFRQGNIHNRTAELGYYLAEPYWRKGIMTEAVRQICAYIFDNTDILRIYAEPFALNIGSCRVLEKAGFQYEGTLKNNAVKNGKVLDMKMYALTRACESVEKS